MKCFIFLFFHDFEKDEKHLPEFFLSYACPELDGPYIKVQSNCMLDLAREMISRSCE